MVTPRPDYIKLSKRESQILDLAAEGLTDTQIAQRIKISPSTVNSYWVRIRGKLGHLSRTELVAGLLRGEAQVRFDDLMLHNIALEKTIADSGLISDNADHTRAAIDALPEALVSFDEGGMIVVANRFALALFGYTVAELMGAHISKLLPPKRSGAPSDLDEPWRVEGGRPLGMHELVFGRNCAGQNFRVILLVGSTDTPDGRITSCVIRPLIEEIDSMRRRAAVFTKKN